MNKILLDINFVIDYLVREEYRNTFNVGRSFL